MKDKTHRFLWDDCRSIEEQRARVFRQWIADPTGRYNDRWTNKRLLELAIEFWVEPLLRQSGNSSLGGYWCDLVVHFECPKQLMTDLRFSGVMFIFKGQDQRGLVPFEFDMQYETETSNHPMAVSLRLGEKDGSAPIPLIKGERGKLEQTAMEVYSRSRNNAVDWAINLTFDPYETYNA